MERQICKAGLISALMFSGMALAMDAYIAWAICGVAAVIFGSILEMILEGH